MTYFCIFKNFRQGCDIFQKPCLSYKLCKAGKELINFCLAEMEKGQKGIYILTEVKKRFKVELTQFDLYEIHLNKHKFKGGIK